QKPSRKTTGIGIAHTNRRIKRLFGQGQTIDSTPHKATTDSTQSPKGYKMLKYANVCENISIYILYYTFFLLLKNIDTNPTSVNPKLISIRLKTFVAVFGSLLSSSVSSGSLGVPGSS